MFVCLYVDNGPRDGVFVHNYCAHQNQKPGSWGCFLLICPTGNLLDLVGEKGWNYCCYCFSRNALSTVSGRDSVSAPHDLLKEMDFTGVLWPVPPLQPLETSFRAESSQREERRRRKRNKGGWGEGLIEREEGEVWCWSDSDAYVGVAGGWCWDKASQSPVLLAVG